ncbi:MAG: hypothetical protein M1825_001347 [Sarcosagium campestre]|nr:MAG: hypothetical protein M1825_001347 [Sarcosagium campestre]
MGAESTPGGWCVESKADEERRDSTVAETAGAHTALSLDAGVANRRRGLRVTATATAKVRRMRRRQC